jgi:hypothetical protein
MTGVYGDSPRATGDVTAKITVDASFDVQIDDLGKTLCGLLGDDDGLAGVYEDDCLNIRACADGTPPPDATWECGVDGHPPDTDVAGAPAWAVAATYEANPANIQ